ncbi:protein-disulfide isomerase [Streptomyces sp. HB132]|nr:protein-disulfide isomerase [Streptomyces sp. HB132]
MIEYSDFQCPFCGQFARKTEPELLRSYVDKGVLRIEWRNFPVFGPESEQAALAGWPAGQLNKFWEFHDVAYSKPR